MKKEDNISKLDLSVRAESALKKAMNIHTVGELVQIKYSELHSYRGVGNKTIKEIEESISVCKSSLMAESNKKEGKNVLDHFAGLAMQGILSSETEMRSNGGNYINGASCVEYLAKESYEIAKAMVKARKEVLNELNK